MAHHSLNDSRLSLNPSLNHYDNLIESLAKASALTHIILSLSDLEQVSHATLHDFLWALNDLINAAEVACSKLRAKNISS